MIVVRNIILSLGILASVTFAESYRILSVFPYNGKSHNVMFNALMKGLAKRGHQVDDITHFPVKNAPPYYTVAVNLNGTLKSVVNSFTIEFTKTITNGAVENIGMMFGNDICKLLALNDVQQFIKSLPANPPYDVFITEAFEAHCFMGIGHLLKIPVVASSAEYPWINQFIGNYDNLAVNTHVFLSSFDRNNFWERLYNFVIYYWYVYKFNAITEDEQTEYMRKYISPDIPNIREVEKNVALTIVNVSQQEKHI